MKNNNLIVLAVIILFFTINLAEIVSNGQAIDNELDIKKFNNNPKKLSLLSPRYILGEKDEGLHQNNIFKMQEWWYYNVYFNDNESELKNWSIVISFSVYSNGCGLKLGIYNDENKSYNYKKTLNRNSFKYNAPGVNCSFNNSSYVIGRYPKWKIYAEFNASNNNIISINLTFEANSLPMWILKNTGHNRSNSYFGYYCIMNCNAYGDIFLNNTTYNVSGIGYHDHTWAPLDLNKPKFKTSIKQIKIKKSKFLDIYKSWDWLCIHFENGWDMFIGKIYSEKRNIFSKFTPGALCFSPNGKKLYEQHFFLLEYTEKINSSIPNIEIPTKIHIKALFLNTLGYNLLKGPILLDFYYEAKNIQEGLHGNPPYWGIFQSQGKIYGTAKSLGKTINLNGWAIAETTNYF